MPKPTTYCGFCGKADNEVKLFIAGPITTICDECANFCVAVQVNHFGLGEYFTQLLTSTYIAKLEHVKVQSLDSLPATNALKSCGPYTGVDVLKAVVNDLQALLDKEEASRVKYSAKDPPPGESP